jgi:hypothetical protein
MIQYNPFSFTLKTPESEDLVVDDDFLSCLCQRYTEVITFNGVDFTIEKAICFVTVNQ